MGTKPVFELDGNEIHFPKTEIMDAQQALLVGGDWSVPVWAMRADITTKLPTEAVIQDPNTMQIVYNLAQQDMVALRCVFRAGWVLPNPVSRLNMDNESRYPFAVLTPQ